MRDRVPAVEPVNPADVDPGAAEQEDRRQHQPAQDAPVPPLHHALDEEHRAEAEHEPRRRERRDHARVVPERHPGRQADVDEVGDDVRRVGEEQQPRCAEGRKEREAAPAALGVVERQTEQERDPGEKQVPGEEPELAARGYRSRNASSVRQSAEASTSDESVASRRSESLTPKS